MSLLSHPNRKNRLHVLTLDPVLCEDVAARLADDPRTSLVERVRPRGAEIRVEDVEALAQGTVKSRLLIMDVRSHTLPRLMTVFNRVIGYNRRDLNERCYTILIGDGPPALFGSQNSLDIFASLLARFRLDYHPAVFFFDPFTHYTHEERTGLRLDGLHGLPQGLPTRLTKWFKEDNLSVAEVRRYFRADASTQARRAAQKALRTEKLLKLLEARIAEIAPGEEERLMPLLSRTGLRVQQEVLALNVYPLFFEDWAADLLQRAADRATPPSRASG
jgi:hypothetical protein